MSTFAIPDIHGRLDLLDRLLETTFIEWPKDTIVFLGDMIDRGPHSKDVLARIKNLQQTYPKTVHVLLGNHEDMMIQAFEKGQGSRAFQHWMINSGDATLRSYGLTVHSTHGVYGGDTRYYIAADWQDDAALSADVAWLKTLPLFHEEVDFFFSHAPLPDFATYPWTKEHLIWFHPDRPPGQEDARCLIHRHDKIAVCGHIHALNWFKTNTDKVKSVDRGHGRMMEPRFYAKHIFCDAGCGCYYKAPLCAINVETREVTFAWPTIIETRSAS